MHRGRARRAITWILLAGPLAAYVSGCGSGKLGLTGGSIPIGTASLRGIVVRADNTSTAVDGASVVLQRGAQHNDRMTDTGGAFDMGSIGGGAATCTVHPPDSAALRQDWQWDLPIPDGAPAELIVALWPQSFDPAKVNSVTLAPGQYSLRVGQPIKVVASAYDKNGVRLNVMPSLLIVGSAATIAPNGAITATSSGHVTVTAWLLGKTASADYAVIP